MDSSCLFCLDIIKENPTQNPVGCSCKIHAHQSCFQNWFTQKERMECPICHTVAVPTPFHHDQVHVVFVERPTETRPNRTSEKAIAMCCCILLGWAIGLTVIELAVSS